MAEMGVPHYPPERAYHAVFRSVAAWRTAPADLQLVVFGDADRWTGERVIRHFAGDGTEVECPRCGHGVSPADR